MTRKKIRTPDEIRADLEARARAHVVVKGFKPISVAVDQIAGFFGPEEAPPDNLVETGKRVTTTTTLVHIDEPIWFDAETGDVTHALDRDAMTPEEIARLELTGMFDPRHLVRIPQDDGDGSTYNPEFVARVLEAAANPLPERFTAEQMVEHVRALVAKPPRELR